MQKSKRNLLRLITVFFLFLVGLVGDVYVLYATLRSGTLRLWPSIISTAILLAAAVLLFFEYKQQKILRDLVTTFHFERGMYREALVFQCDYAFTVNVTKNRILAIHRVGLLAPFDFCEGGDYDSAILRVMESLKPTMLFGEQDIFLTHHYLDAFCAGKRVLELQYHLPKENLYKKKTVFLTRDDMSGEIYAFVALHDVTRRFLAESKTHASLVELTNAAKQIAAGELDVEINCEADGDVGVLARSFKNTAEELKIYINSIKDLARLDSMTGMANRTSYVGAIADIDVRLRKHEELHFAVVMLDLNDLKFINDVHGHSEGDRAIVRASNLIKDSFPEAQLFRIGGDEFAVILANKGTDALQILSQTFEENVKRHNSEAQIPVSIAHGYAIYNPQRDTCFADVYARADREMYECKRRDKKLTV